MAPAGHTPDGDPHRPVIEEHEPLLRRLGVGQRVRPRVERVDAAEVLHRGPWAVDEAARLQLPRAGQTVPTRHDASAGPCGLSTTRHTRQPRRGSRVASRGRRGRARPRSQVVRLLMAPPARALGRARAGAGTGGSSGSSLGTGSSPGRTTIWRSGCPISAISVPSQSLSGRVRRDERSRDAVRRSRMRPDWPGGASGRPGFRRPCSLYRVLIRLGSDLGSPVRSWGSFNRGM